MSFGHSSISEAPFASGPQSAVSPNVSVYPAGVYGTGAVGDVSLQIFTNIFVTGVQASGLVGQQTTRVTPALSGVFATGELGTALGACVGITTGVFATGSIGTVVPRIHKLLTGVSATGQIGVVLIGGWIIIPDRQTSNWVGVPVAAGPVWENIDTGVVSTWEEVTT